jgi:hypothetical protein
MNGRVSVIACIGTALVAGCASHPAKRVVVERPTLPRPLALELASLSDAVATKLEANDPCGALEVAGQLQSRAAAAVAAGKIRPALRRQLTSATSRLQAEITCVPPPARPEHGRHEGHGHGKHDGQNGQGD